MVIWDNDPYFTPGSQELLTDADGKYIMPTLKPSKRRSPSSQRDFSHNGVSLI